MRRGGRPSRTEYRSMPPDPTRSEPCGRRRGRSTRTGRSAVHSAGSASHRRRSRTKHWLMMSPLSSASTVSRSGCGMRYVPGPRRRPGSGWRQAQGSFPVSRRSGRGGTRRSPRRIVSIRRRFLQGVRYAAASASGRCGTGSGTRRCRTRRRSVSGFDATVGTRFIAVHRTSAKAPRRS